ncbi:CYTH domain-containing protein [Terribacillus halophilus]|uniref:CYTH domain-containing protein n=1 Tax=Terribacillus halophilus TaxID=361279 RepID=A0A1G6KX30_9BACI|nr:CYTH domain-containing protein [Terribacillus halophilus]SDC35650.1 CYTH domain-containing protein [Terribacillus halophilus]
MKKLSIAVLIALLLITVFPTMSFAEDSPINPGHEVKFMLDVSQFATTDDLVNAFHASHDEDLKVYYFDTPDQIFRKLNYVHRLRIYDGDKKTDITYKKTFPDQAPSDAIAEAAEHDFHGDMSNYKYEIDKKPGKDSFSISRKEKFNKNDKLNYDNGIDIKYALDLFREEAPKKYRNWDDQDWYYDTLEQAVPYGPAAVSKFEGNYEDIDADLEIWHYKGETIAEISTKTDDADDADVIQEKWSEALANEGWLSTNQQSKTSFVMDR